MALVAASIWPSRGLADQAAIADPTPSVGLLFAVTLALVCGAAMAFWIARLVRRLTNQLRQARARSTCLEPLLDVWIWQTDVTHTLVSTQPPHGAPKADWLAATAGAPLWQHFTAAGAAEFRGQLDAAAAIDDAPAALAGRDGPARPGRLRARPYFDASGSFAGYHGIFIETVPSALPSAPPTAPPTATPSATAGAPERPVAEPLAAQPAAAAPPAVDNAHDAFSFTVSHDLRAPIRVVEGFTKIVKEDYGRLLDRVGNDHLDRVLTAAARMNNMIDALLSLSKLSSQPLARQPVNLSQLAGFVVDDLRRQWPERRVSVEIEPAMIVAGDPTLLRVVIENLVGNAWKYTGKVGEASVTFARHPTQVDTFVLGDNGAGFDMRFADRLFGVFQRLHSAGDFPGTGVGLASVRRIVQRHGGEIWGEAELNHGARFQFSLPQALTSQRP